MAARTSSPDNDKNLMRTVACGWKQADSVHVSEAKYNEEATLA